MTKPRLGPLLQAAVVSAWLSATAGRSTAHQAEMPPVSSETLVGTWEAVDPEGLRLYVLKIGSMKPSEVDLVVVAGPGENPVVFAYRADSIRVDRNGRLVMTGSSEQHGDAWSVEVDVVGTAYEDDGLMRGQVLIWRKADKKWASRFQVLFTRSDEGFTRWLLRARTKAEGKLQTHK